MFYLRVYDNYHYGDESEAYNHGQYATYAEAVAGAKAIVDEFMEWNWRENMRPNQLAALFGIYGEDPVIFPNEPGNSGRFSASDYATEAAEKACKKLQKGPYTPENYAPLMHDYSKPSGTGDA
ncbi:MAG TPA: hypothetical protein VK205_01330 [Prolixibacteraceae bacterium]|nr:hypothetical protein [Prolixibacteraceae bacterium]